VVFIFDNKGRGGRSVQLFRQAAEEQGYVLAASNDIVENDSIIRNVRVATRLMNRVINLLPVDNNGMYTAGFMEGARVASLMPAVFSNIQGVMAIGDVWVNPDYIQKQAKFSFIGISGTKDHKYQRMKESVSLLSKAGL